MSEIHRVVGIAPTSRGFGFAVLEDGEVLVDWGLVHCRPPKPGRVADRAFHLLERHSPDLVVLPATGGSRYGDRAKGFLALVEEGVRSTNFAVSAVSSDAVRRHFASHGLTKHERAIAIAQRFPELRPRLSDKRRPWQSQDECMAIFTALSLAITAKASGHC